MKSKRSLSIVGAATLLLLATAPFSQADSGDHMMVSVSSTGVAANYDTFKRSLSGDGRYVVFDSLSTNLVPNDTNYHFDVFVHDRVLRTTRRVSVTSTGAQASGSMGAISRDGRYVAFYSSDPNLVANDTNGVGDVFIHDNLTRETFRASVTATGGQANGASSGPSFSGNGRYLVFQSEASNLTPGDTNGLLDIFVADLQTGALRLASISTEGLLGNGISHVPSINGDGRYVAFTSWATNFELDDTNGAQDTFVRDLTNGITTRVSKSSEGAQGNSGSWGQPPSMSDDGRFVAFTSQASNLTPDDISVDLDVFVRDRQTNTTKLVSIGGNNFGEHCQMDASGRLIVYASFEKTMLHDQFGGTVEQISPPTFVGYYSQQTAISADGRIVSYAGPLAGYQAPILSYTYELGERGEMISFKFNRSTVAGQNAFSATVEMNSPAGASGTILQVSSSSSLIEVPTTIKIPAGMSSGWCTVKSYPVEVPKVESVTIRWGTQSLMATITLLPLVPSAFQFTPRPVIGGQPLSVRMVMNGVAPTGGKVVMLSDNSAFATTPASVMVPAGAPQVIFPIQTLPVSSMKYVTITAAVPGGSKTAHFVIRP